MGFDMKKRKKTRGKPEQPIIDAVQNEIYGVARSLGLKQTVRLFEASIIACALKESEGNLSEAARILDVPSTTLQSKRDVMESVIDKAARKIKKSRVFDMVET